VATERPGAWEVSRVLLLVGLAAFGGPVAHVALMRRQVVERRRWVGEREFLGMFAACNLIPGPSSTELAIYLGYRLAGWAGLVLSGVLFIAPAMLLMLGIAVAYTRFGATPAGSAILHGVRPVVVAIMLWALVDLGRRVAGRWPLLLVGLAVLVLSRLGANPLLLLLAGGAAVVAPRALGRLRPVASVAALAAPGWQQWLLAGARGRALPLFLTFVKIGAVTYGSGYVLFAFLQADLVDGLGWIQPRQLVDAVAIGQVTPGPVFTTATFLGYLAAGVPGAVLATLGIFLPGFLLVPLLARIVRLVESRPVVRSFLDGVNVAVIGLIAAVGLQLGTASITDGWTAAIAALGFPVLLWRPLSAPAVVLAGAVAGLGLWLAS